MTQWVPGKGQKMTIGDVWRWPDAYFWKEVFMGHRMLEVQCLGEAERAGFWKFEVRSCTVVGESRDSRRPIPKLKVGAVIERAFKTLLKGGAERRVWSEDESGRSMRASKYLGNDEHEQLMSTEAGAPPPLKPRDKAVPARRKKRKKSTGGKRLKPARGRSGPRLKP